ncbi:DnaJ-like protein subfamily C member 1 [Aix galericulata]|nr:DnaJ-like protein subfamily C member 1 [Aix galericulata]
MLHPQCFQERAVLVGCCLQIEELSFQCQEKMPLICLLLGLVMMGSELSSGALLERRQQSAELLQLRCGVAWLLAAVPPDASSADIRKAYRKLSLILHPDKNKDENAETQFRQLVAIYEILKDEERRQRYDDILINGLPDWRQPVFYYRRVRKMSNAELALLLFIILTVGHYAVVWSIYLEKQLDELLTRKKREKKKKAGGRGTDEAKLAALDKNERVLDKPQWHDLLPCKLGIWFCLTVKALPQLFQDARQLYVEYKETKMKEKEDALAKAELETLQKEKKPKVKKPKSEFPVYTVQESNAYIPSYDHGASIEEIEEQMDDWLGNRNRAHKKKASSKSLMSCLPLNLGEAASVGAQVGPRGTGNPISLGSILLACHLRKCAASPVSNAEKKSKEARRRLQLCKGWKLEKEVEVTVGYRLEQGEYIHTMTTLIAAFSSWITTAVSAFKSSSSVQVALFLQNWAAWYVSYPNAKQIDFLLVKHGQSIPATERRKLFTEASGTPALIQIDVVWKVTMKAKQLKDSVTYTPGVIRLSELKTLAQNSKNVKVNVNLPDHIITQREREEEEEEAEEGNFGQIPEQPDSQTDLKESAVSETRHRKRKLVKAPETGLTAAKEVPEEKGRGRRQKDFDNTEQEEESDDESRKREKSRALEDLWTQNQQKLLEMALQQYPKGTTDRWDKIAKCVPGKSKEECIARYKLLVELHCVFGTNLTLRAPHPQLLLALEAPSRGPKEERQVQATQTKLLDAALCLTNAVDLTAKP